MFRVEVTTVQTLSKIHTCHGIKYVNKQPYCSRLLSSVDNQTQIKLFMNEHLARKLNKRQSYLTFFCIKNPMNAPRCCCKEIITTLCICFEYMCTFFLRNHLFIHNIMHHFCLKLISIQLFKWNN